MKQIFRKLADNTNRSSLSAMLRRKRFSKFVDLLDTLSKTIDRPLHVLDVGGTEAFWEAVGYSSERHNITLLNLTAPTTRNRNFNSIAGDARQMNQFHDGQFDIVFSNSVIEHVGTFADQRRMAEEIRRVAPRYFVQTPSLSFPLEPHFLFPFFHWLPRSTRIWLVRHFSLGWFRKTTDAQEASRIVDGIRLLKCSELRTLFPDASIIRERVFWTDQIIYCFKILKEDLRFTTHAGAEMPC